MKIFVLLFVVFVAGVSANCGCLKCNPDFKSIVTPGPRCPVTIVYKDSGVCPIGCPKPLPYSVQAPVLPPPPPCGPGKSYGYQLVVPCQEYYHDCRAPLPYTVQAPVIPPVPCPIKPPLTGLEYCTDTVVLPSPYRRCPETCVNQPGKWVYQPGKSCNPVPAEIDIIPTCSCRYETKKSRSKRDLPIIKHGVNFMVGLLPPFIKDPIRQTVKIMGMHDKNANKKKKVAREKDLNKASYDFIEALNKEEMSRQKILKRFQPQNLLRPQNDLLRQQQNEVRKPLTAREKAVLLEKLKKVAGNKRQKRSIIIGSDEISLPFFEVKDDDEVTESSSQEYYDESDEEIVGFSKKFQRKMAQKREDFEVRHPLLYLMKAPINLLKQFNEVKQTLDPVLKEGAQILGSSKQYFKDFHKNFQSGMLNLASNVIGDFDVVGPKSNYLDDILRPARRYRRDLTSKSRQKRYILKVVDEDEVQEFLKEKLGDYIDGGKAKKAKKQAKVKDEDVIKKIMNDPKVGGQLKVEKLKPKIIIDNNGVPFMEMNGVKRPLGLKRRKMEVSQETPTENENTSESENEKTGDKLSDLIQMARERVENGEPVVQSQHVEMPVLTIKEKITATLTEVDNLINMNFDNYGDIYDQLLQAQNIKTSIVEDWRKILMERKINDIASKLSLLDKLKELQEVKDGCVHSIAKIMPQENHFMTKTWIIVNIRLQKLQCLITRVVDEFSERLKANIPFNVQREIKYVDLLSSINLVYGLTRNDNLNALRKARDETLQEEMTLLENLRKLLLTKNTQLINETAATLWEMKNIEKLEKDTVQEINKRIDNNQKIKKELKIIFDLEKQWDQCNIQLKTSLTTMKTTPKTENHQTYWLDKYRKTKT